MLRLARLAKRTMPAVAGMAIVGVAVLVLAAATRSVAPRFDSTAWAQVPEPDLFDPAVVRDYRLTFHDADWEQRLGQVGETGFIYADLEVDGETYRDVGVRLKGNSSSRGPGRKKPLNLTLDARVQGQDLMGYDTVNLNNGFADPTLVRETLTTDALRPFQPMPKTAYVRAHINGAYFGVYTLMQQIEGRFTGAWFPHGDGILFKADPVVDDGGPPPGPTPTPRRPGPTPTFLAVSAPNPARAGGLCLRCREFTRRATIADHPARPDQPAQPGGSRPDLRWLGEDLAPYKRAYELKTESAGDEGYAKLREMIRVLDAPVAQGGVGDADFPAAIEKVLDVDGALWYIAALNLFTNYDSYYSGHNYFLYGSEADGRFHILSWDVNESFGVFPGAGISPGDRRAVVQTDPFLMTTGQQAAARPLIRRLLAVPRFRADYLAHYRTLLGEAFRLADLEARVKASQDLIRESVQTDPNLLYALDLFDRNVWEDVSIGRAVPGLLLVAKERAAWLEARDDLRAPDTRLASHVRDPDQPTTKDEVRVVVSFDGGEWPLDVALVYRVDDGAPATVPFMPGDVSFFATIPAQATGAEVAYYVRATYAGDRVAFFPAANATQAWKYSVAGAVLPVVPGGDLVLNEVLADNAAAAADPAGEFDDWIELYNRGARPIALGGYHLSDAEDDPLAFRLPDVTLAPGAHVVIWCDDDGGQGADHAPFKLGKDGETVLLSTADATVDMLAFGPQETDVSWAREPDGTGAWGRCGRPSAGRPNACGGGAVATATSTAVIPQTPTTEPRKGKVFLPLAWKP